MPQLVAFHDVRFPTDIAFGSSGGPERRTEIVTLGSGHEQRNARWANSRRNFDAGYGVKSLGDLDAIIAFFEERRGALHGFRYRDPLDWKSCAPKANIDPADQQIGVGDGSSLEFQIAKTYGSGLNNYQRLISKPVEGSVRVAIDSIEKSAGIDFTVDASTGVITFITGAVPLSGEIVSAGFLFDVPVRFANDKLTINLASFEAGDAPAIPLVEVNT